MSGDPIDADFTIEYSATDNNGSVVVEKVSDDAVTRYWKMFQSHPKLLV